MIELKGGFEYIIQTKITSIVYKIKVLELTKVSCYIKFLDNDSTCRFLLEDFHFNYIIIEDLTSIILDKALEEYSKQPKYWCGIDPYYDRGFGKIEDVVNLSNPKLVCSYVGEEWSNNIFANKEFGSIPYGYIIEMRYIFDGKPSQWELQLNKRFYKSKESVTEALGQIVKQGLYKGAEFKIKELYGK